MRRFARLVRHNVLESPHGTRILAHDTANGVAQGYGRHTKTRGARPAPLNRTGVSRIPCADLARSGERNKAKPLRPIPRSTDDIATAAASSKLCLRNIRQSISISAAIALNSGGASWKKESCSG